MLFEKGILLCCNGFRFEQLFLFLVSHVSLFLFPELEILLIEIYPKEDMSFDLEKQHENLVWLFCNIKKNNFKLQFYSSTNSYILYETQKKVLENLNFCPINSANKYEFGICFNPKILYSFEIIFWNCCFTFTSFVGGYWDKKTQDFLKHNVFATL